MQENVQIPSIVDEHETNCNQIDVEANYEKILALLRSTERPNIERIIKVLESSDYFTAPASTRHHLPCVGGLAQHSLNVTNEMGTLKERYHPLIPDESAIIIGLLHDMCKVDQYHPQFNKNGKLSATPYKTYDQFPMGHGEKSVMMILPHMELTPAEIAGIRWHMSAFDPSWRQGLDKAGDKFPEVWLASTADLMATKFIDPLYFNNDTPANPAKQ